MHIAWWIFFAFIILSALTVDLTLIHRHAHRESMREAIIWSIAWVGLGLFFSIFVFLVKGLDGGIAYITAYLIEKSLSMDNLFVFFGLFMYFGVPPENHHRVLFWGILGALFTRALFIFGGVVLLSRFDWVNYLLGLILLYTGAKLLKQSEEVHPERNVVIRWLSRRIPMEHSYFGDRFFTRNPTGFKATPLFVCLISIEAMDVMFAVDSVPAVLAISHDPFVIYTSNIFAILGLRALYFVLAGALRSLRYLRPALALILSLVGIKMLLVDYIHVPVVLSLALITLILAGASFFSIIHRKR